MVVAATALLAASASALTVRTMSDRRIWQTAMNPSAPLSWPWEAGADSAVLTLSNRMNGAVSSIAVAKSGNDLYGSCAVPLPGDGSEAFFAAELALFAGSAEVVRRSADIAYVNGVAGRRFDVQVAGSKAWQKVPSPRLAAYDAAWLDSTAGASEASLSVTGPFAGPEVRALPGTSGYTTIFAPEYGRYLFELGFDDNPRVWAASLLCGRRGIALLFR